MLRSISDALRLYGLAAAAALCPRENLLPIGESRLDREWRLGLYRALQQADVTYYRNQCDVAQLFVPGSINVLGGGEKDSASESIILAGVLAPPNNPQVAQRFAEPWARMKCDVVAKISFPRTYEVPLRNQTSALQSEISLYDFLSKLVEHKVTPNLVLGLGVFDCTVQQLTSSSDTLTASKLLTQARNIYVENKKVLRGDDPVRILLLERGRGFTLDKGLQSHQINEQQLISIVFQCIYTLNALARRRIRHGDLHVGNVFIDLLSESATEIAYFPFSNADEDVFYQIPTFGYIAKIYDWDWGGVYEVQRGTAVVEAWPQPTELIRNAFACSPNNRKRYGACGTNSKADAYTLLTNLYDMDETQNMSVFRRFAEQVIDRRVLEAAPNFDKYGGFPYRACQGPIKDGRVSASRRCKGTWEPSDFLMKPLSGMMHSELFANFRHSLRDALPTTTHVYGDWQTEAQFRDFERHFQSTIVPPTSSTAPPTSAVSVQSPRRSKRRAAQVPISKRRRR